MNNTRTRYYRMVSQPEGLVKFEVEVEESNLLIMADADYKSEVLKELIQQRNILKSYIKQHPEFYYSFTPVKAEGLARRSEQAGISGLTAEGPEIIRLMAESSFLTDTGPMASVAGAIAEIIGRKLLRLSARVIVENGGDIFLKVDRDCTVAIFAGPSPLSMKLGIRISPASQIKGIATSSGKVGHSFSYGKADALTVLSGSAVFSDGAATALANRVKGKADLEKLPLEISKYPFVEGVLAIIDEELFVWGNIELVYL